MLKLHLPVNNNFKVLLILYHLNRHIFQVAGLSWALGANMHHLGLGWEKPLLRPIHQSINVCLKMVRDISNPTIQLSVISKELDTAVYLSWDVIDEDSEQCWPQNQSLRNSACDWGPCRLGALDHYPLLMTNQEGCDPVQQLSTDPM